MKDEALKLALEALKNGKRVRNAEGGTKYQPDLEDKAITAIKQALAAQPAVPDAFGTREGEHPEYIQGWNDCRAEMLRHN
jgi:hypothetical protein